MKKINLKNIFAAAAVLFFLTAGAAAAVDIGWQVGSSAIGSILSPKTALPIGIPMQPSYLTAVTATTTAGSLATSTIVTYNFSNATSGVLATGTVPLSYYFEVSANDQIGGQTLPSSELSTNVSSSATTNEVIATWAPVQGALYYDLYIGTSTGAESLLATTTATTFTLSTTTATSSTGISLAIPPTVNTAYADVINPNGSIKLGNSVYMQTIDGLGIGTIATGTGAGAGPTVTTTYANSISAVFLLKTGTSPSSSAPIVTIAFPYQYPKPPSCDFQAENSTTAALSATSTPYVINNATSAILESNVSGLAASTNYAWGMQCQN